MEIRKLERIIGEIEVIGVDDIDTDQIFHASLLTIHDPEEIKAHIFGNLDDFKLFGHQDHEGKIITVGKNFGKGSTRQQAVTGFLAHGIQAIIGSSFSPIYYNNAINEGLLLIHAPDSTLDALKPGMHIEIRTQLGKVIDLGSKVEYSIEKVPMPVLEIIEAGGLLKLGKR
jgi:3-isopropylmalate/(R)-2-methylmalate dehydratase small subunit